MSDTLKFTSQQQEAINFEGGSVIVSAAAGSGKTKVLIERLIRKICNEENPLSISELTMVTFTNDAAAGMKRKLSDAIAQKLRENPRNTRLRRETALIPIARISTVHSFCFDLIRDNIVNLPISAGFFVIDENRAEMMLERAVKTVFEHRFNKDEKSLEYSDIDFLSDIFNVDKRDCENLKKICINIYNKLRSIPFYNKFLVNCAEQYNQELSQILKENYIKYLSDELQTAKTEAQIALETAEIFGFENLYNSLAIEADLIDDAVNDFNDKLSRGATFEELIDIETIIFENFKKGTNPPEKDLNDIEKSALKNIKNKREHYKKILSSTGSELTLFTQQDISDDLLYNADVCAKLSQLINDIDIEYSMQKMKINALDFSDAEHMALSVLAEQKNNEIIPTKAAYDFAQKNKLVMIDEYQDTNDVQDLIFRLISRRDENGNPENLYLVGDVKQSIYGFRSANPRIFIRLSDQAEATGNPHLIRLSRNFRSSREVVDFTNAVFSPILKKDTFDGINYESDKLIYGANFNDNKAIKGDRTTEFIVANEGVNEAVATAKRIKFLIDNKTMICENNEYRPCKPSDFCILMRDRKQFASFENALKNAGVNAASESTDTYLSSYEIQVLMNLLRILDNPHQDVALASVLMSPMFGFSSEDMAQIRLTNRKSTFFTALKDALNTDTSLTVRIQNTLNEIVMLKDLSRTLPIDKLIGAIYDRTQFLNAVSFRFSDGAKKKANLRLMITYAKNYVQNDIFADVAGFIRYIESIMRMKGDFSSAANTDSAHECVQIKTIHKSKGLEFPFVFLCDIAKDFNEAEISDPLMFHPLYGVGLRYQKRTDENGDFTKNKRYKTFPQFVLSYIKRRELRAESVRLLYVALTRAKERLFISFSSEDIKKISDINAKTNPESCKNFLSLFACVFHDREESGIFRGEQVKNTENGLFRTIIINPDENAEEITDTVQFYKPDEAMIKRLESLWSLKYQSADVEKTAKMTVSEIALNSDITHVYSVRNISLHFSSDISETPHLTASEKGTAMHRFLQKCNFPINDTKAEAERLFGLGILSKLELQSLNFGRLTQFFHSAFYKRHIETVDNDKIYREFKIYAKLDDIHLDETLKKVYNISRNTFLQGVADLVIDTGTALTLVDYKTNANYFTDADGKTAEELFEEHLRDLYTMQIRVYATAIAAIFGKSVTKAYLYSFALGREIEIEIHS